MQTIKNKINLASRACNVEIKQVTSNNIDKKFIKIGVSKEGVNIIAQKCNTYIFKINNIRTPGANILKQDVLSIGGDLACPAGVILNKSYYTNVFLIANLAQLKKICNKISKQDFGLKNISLILKQEIKKIIQMKTKTKIPKLMGIINITPDSFYKNSIVKNKKIIKQIKKQIKNGAKIIDIGAISSRPNSKEVSKKKELGRLKFIFKYLHKNKNKNKLLKKTIFSIDTFRACIAKKAIKCGFGIINDISGGTRDKNMFKVVANTNLTANTKIIIMHMQNKPSNMQNNPKYRNVIYDIDNFFTQQIKIAMKNKIKRKNIILDPGIGFGKTLQHNIKIINNIKYFKKQKCKILIGASRKSLINDIIKSSPKYRLSGTLSVHLKAYQNGADILRIHDISEHKQALMVYKKLN